MRQHPRSRTRHVMSQYAPSQTSSANNGSKCTPTGLYKLINIGVPCLAGPSACTSWRCPPSCPLCSTMCARGKFSKTQSHTKVSVAAEPSMKLCALQRIPTPRCRTLAHFCTCASSDNIEMPNACNTEEMKQLLPARLHACTETNSKEVTWAKFPTIPRGQLTTQTETFSASRNLRTLGSL